MSAAIRGHLSALHSRQFFSAKNPNEYSILQWLTNLVNTYESKMLGHMFGASSDAPICIFAFVIWITAYKVRIW